MTRRQRHPRPWHDGRDVGSAVAATIPTSLPVFLTGAMAVQIRDTLHFGTTAYGVAVALYYLAAGTSSIPLGRLSERLGGLRTMRLAVLGSSVVLGLLAGASRSWALLAVLLVAAGVVSAAMQPAANVFLVGRISPERQGLSFGIKQAAVPLATSLAGLAVPGLALTVGWRWAYAVGAAWAIATAVVLPHSVATARPPRPARSCPAGPWSCWRWASAWGSAPPARSPPSWSPRRSTAGSATPTPACWWRSAPWPRSAPGWSSATAPTAGRTPAGGPTWRWWPGCCWSGRPATAPWRWRRPATALRSTRWAARWRSRSAGAGTACSTSRWSA